MQPLGTGIQRLLFQGLIEGLAGPSNSASEAGGRAGCATSCSFLDICLALVKNRLKIFPKSFQVALVKD